MRDKENLNESIIMEYYGTNLTEAGHYRWSLDGKVMVKHRSYRCADLPFHPETLTNNLPKGDIIFYQGGGYTVVGISGSCRDSRPGSESIFWVKELLTAGEMGDRIKNNHLAMELISAMPFELTEKLK